MILVTAGVASLYFPNGWIFYTGITKNKETGEFDTGAFFSVEGDGPMGLIINDYRASSVDDIPIEAMVIPY